MEYVAVAEVVADGWDYMVGSFAALAVVAGAAAVVAGDVAAMAQIPVAGGRMMEVVGMLAFARIVVVQEEGLAGPVGRVSGKSL